LENAVFAASFEARFLAEAVCSVDFGREPARDALGQSSPTTRQVLTDVMADFLRGRSSSSIAMSSSTNRLYRHAAREFAATLRRAMADGSLKRCRRHFTCAKSDMPFGH